MEVNETEDPLLADIAFTESLLNNYANKKRKKKFE